MLIFFNRSLLIVVFMLKLFLIGIAFPLFSQNNVTSFEDTSIIEDSIYKRLKEANNKLTIDSYQALEIINSVFDEIQSNNIDDVYLNASANLLKGQILFQQASFKKSEQYLSKSSSLFKLINDDNQYLALDLLGYVYIKLGNNEKVISNQVELLGFYTKNGDVENIGYTYAKLAKAYEELKQYKNAIDNYKKATTYFNKNNNTEQYIKSLSNLAVVYSNYGDFDSAHQSIISAISLVEQNKEYSNLLDVFMERKKRIDENRMKANKNVTQLQVDEKIQLDTKLDKALKQSALSLAEIEKLSEEKQLIELKIKAQQDDYEKEILNQKLDKVKLENEIQNKNLINKNLTLALENEQVTLEKKKAENQRLYLFLGALLIILSLLALLLFQKMKSNKALQEKNRFILNQKFIIEEKTKAINQSIIYAKNIQNAIVKPSGVLQSSFPQSFVFLKPKDEVSGDFFIDYRVGDTSVFVAADCTGHGVPGAFMSIILKTILDEIIVVEKTFTPHLILQNTCLKLAERIINSPESVGKLKDGMDASIVSFNHGTQECYFAGARNGIYIVSDGNLIHHKGVRKSVCASKDANYLNSFESIVLNLKKNDSLYMYSDGFMDQKGGENGKKYFHPPFRNLLVRLTNMNAAIQNQEIEKEFERWKGDYDQVDDVLVVGFKIF